MNNFRERERERERERAMEDYLVHYGIKGMKWGVRRTEDQLQKDNFSRAIAAEYNQHHIDKNAKELKSLHKQVKRGDRSVETSKRIHDLDVANIILTREKGRLLSGLSEDTVNKGRVATTMLLDGDRLAGGLTLNKQFLERTSAEARLATTYGSGSKARKKLGSLYQKRWAAEDRGNYKAQQKYTDKIIKAQAKYYKQGID